MIKMREKREKSSKKRKIVVYSFVILIFITTFFAFNPIPNSKAEITDNYTEYLYNHNLVIYNDKAMITQSLADTSNNYRNLFDTNFLFPSHLSVEMFNAFNPDLSRYVISQAYFDNLDNNYAFMSNNDSENIETQQYINFNPNDVNNGTYYKPTPDLLTAQYFYLTDYISYSNCHVWNTTDGYKTNPNIFDGYIDDLPLHPIYNNSYMRSVSSGKWSYVSEISNVSDSYSEYQTIAFMLFGYINDFNRVGSSVMPYLCFELLDKDFNLYQKWNFTSYHTEYNHIYYYIYPIIYNLTLSYQEFNEMKMRITSFSNTEFGEFILSDICLVVDFDYNLTYNPYEKGIYGQFESEYTFTDDITGNNPTDWTVNEGADTSIDVYEKLTNHKKIVEISDDSIGNKAILSQDLNALYGTDFENGIIEFYIYITSTTKAVYFYLYDADLSKSIYMIWDSDGILKYYHGGKIAICSYSENTWYHIRIQFDCSNLKWSLWINQNFMSDSYTYNGVPLAMDNIRFNSDDALWNYDFYIDAVDYNWTDWYYINRNIYSYYSYVELEKEIQINFYDITDYTPVFFDIYSAFAFNQSIYYYVQVWNYDLEEYFTIISNNSLKFCFELYFRLNESGYIRFNKIKLRIITDLSDLHFQLYHFRTYLNVIYVKPNNNGYSKFSIKTMKFSELPLDLYIGYNLLDVWIYNCGIYYQFQEKNFYADDYIQSVKFLNYSNYPSIENETIETLEIIYHMRFGFNTVEKQLGNFLIQFYINGKLILDYIDQDRKYYGGHHYLNLYNYSICNRNYLNLTGIVGNYSYNTLNGLRTLCGLNTLTYERFFNIPLFKDTISLQEITTYIFTKENEPQAPSKTYWTYELYELVQDTSFDTEIGNWSISFTPIKPQITRAKFFYNEHAIKYSDWGNWEINVGVKVNLNFIKRWLIDIVNFLYFVLQFAWYLCWASMSYVLTFIGFYIVAFLFNVVIYYIFIGLIWAIWYLYLALLWVLDALIWIWRNLIIPLIEWIWIYVVPVVMDWVVKIIAFFLTCLFWILTLGRIDFWSTYDLIYEMLWIIINELIAWFYIFVDNFEYIIFFIAWYVVIVALLYFRYMLARTRGFDKKAQKIYYTFTFFFTPIKIVIDWIKALLDITPTG